MDKKSFYQECHKTLGELSEFRQVPFIKIDIENRLRQDNAISKNGLDAVMTPKGDDLFQSKYYLELAEKVENEERVRELRERDSLMNQKSVEEAIEQNKINKQILSYQKINIIISGIAAIGVLLGLVCRCN